jgi:hypothetical protein
MNEPDEPARFRAAATRVYRVVRLCLGAFVIAASWVGWHFGRWLGLAIATACAVVVAAIVLAGVALIWAMTQDGG